MLLYSFNSDLDPIGLVEDYSYLKWNRRYSKCGEFELKAAVNDKNIAQLISENIIWKNDSDEAGVIERLSIDGTIITAGGRFMPMQLDRRIIWGTLKFSGSPLTNCVNTIITSQVTQPTDSSRKLPFWDFEAESAITIPVTFQASYKNVLEQLEALCEEHGVGLRTSFQPKSKRIALSLYIGSENTAIFSPEFENLLNPVYTESVADLSNVALVAGQGEGEDRQRVTVGGGSGLVRRELYVDARDLSPEEYPDYTQALTRRGQDKLSERAAIYSFDAEANTRGNLKYRQDFDLGDMVTVFSRQLQKSLRTRIAEVIETYEENNLNIDLVFGNTLPTVADRLSKIEGR